MTKTKPRLSSKLAVILSAMQHQQTFNFDAPPASPPNREEEPVLSEPQCVATDTSLPPPHATPEAATEPAPSFVRPDRQIVYPDATSHYDWPDAKDLQDRDTITVDRISDDTAGPAHRFVIKRGDTVKAYMGVDRFHVGVVIGISHVKHEVRVAWDDSLKKGGWFRVGAIYPTVEPEPTKQQPGKPLSESIEQLNDRHAPDNGWQEADRVPNQAPFTFSEFKDVWKASADGTLTFAEYQESFERIIASEAEITSELKADRNAKQLKVLASRFGDWNAKSNTKQENAKSIYDKMMSFFLLDGTVSFAMGESYTNAVIAKVRAVTQEEWTEHHSKVAEKKADNEAALANPQTLADVAKFVEAKGAGALTNEQMAQWDTLHADLARERRVANGPSAMVTQFEADELAELGFTISEGYHTKRECKLWIVQIDKRVDRAAFNELNGKAKMLGGRYSNFRGSPDPAGFQFFDEEAAKRFISLTGGDEDRTDILAARKDRKELTAAERLHELAESMLIEADTMLSDSEQAKQNTVKRAREQAGKRGNAFRMQAMARTMHSIAEAISTGEATYLDGLRHRTHVATLELVLKDAKWNRIRAMKQDEGEHGYDFRRRKDAEEEEPISEDDIRHSTYPYPFAYKSNLESAIAYCERQRGLKQLSAKLAKRIKNADNFIRFERDYDIDQLNAFITRAKAAGYDAAYLEDGTAKYNRLQRAGITEIHTLRAALREYLGHRGEARGDDPVKIAERELIGKKLPGFFPTPPSLIAEMLEYAQLRDGHRVLEPSAGKGDLVTAINDQAAEVTITAIEQNRTLADVLSAKGIDVEFADFLEHTGTYDRIIQNPPFEAGQDIDHVRHAFDCLTPGGRLVSVICEGPFFRTDKKSVAFRQWIDELGAESYELPADAFNTAEAFRQTGVKTRILVLDKP